MDKLEFYVEIVLKKDFMFNLVDDEFVPTESIEKDLQERFGSCYVSDESSFAKMSFYILNYDSDESDLYSDISRIINETTFSDDEDIFTIEIKKKIYISKDNVVTEEIKAQKVKEKLFNTLNQLVGFQEFKDEIKEIFRISSLLKKNKNVEALKSRVYLFSIDDGCGLTTALDILLQTYKNSGILNIRDDRFTEYAIEPSKDSKIDKIADMADTMDCISKDAICIDISEAISKVNGESFKLMLRNISMSVRVKLVVFRVPYVNKDIIQMITDSLNDIFFVKEITFIPYSSEELVMLAKERLKQLSYTLNDNCYNVLVKKIVEEKNDGHFYGIATMNKICNELVFNKIITSGEEVNYEITEDDVNKTIKDQESEIKGYEELDSLIGIEDIKQRIMEVVTHIQASIKYKANDRPCIHMRFTGAPGTGKTTVARILGKILKEAKILSIGNFFEVSGRGLVGQYIGHTAPKTMQICRDAHGSVLFIDEAYSLYRNVDNGKDFGQEALDTIIAELENHRSDMVVIFAGYSDEMDLLLKGNIGLASRVPYEIKFPNYSRINLFKIFMSMVNKGHTEYSIEFEKEVKDYFNNLPDSLLESKDFGNARFVRNLYDRTWGKAALRTELAKISMILEVDDFQKATNEREFAELSKKRTKKLGF